MSWLLGSAASRRRGIRHQLVDAVSLAYLRIWIHAKPDAYALRLVLARHELTHGNLYASEQVLQPMLNAADVTPQDLS